jgi:heat shock protein HtpX
MWWNGGRQSRSGDREGGGNPLALVGFALLIFAPLIARAMQFAVSRQREYLADSSGVQLTRYPPGLISALKKLQADTTVVHSSSKATAHLWIEEPLDTESKRPGVKLNRLFATHPPLEDRIAALEAM